MISSIINSHAVLYIKETTMNSYKVEINKSFALWKKSRHIKLFLLGNSAFNTPPPSPHPFATALRGAWPSATPGNDATVYMCFEGFIP